MRILILSDSHGQKEKLHHILNSYQHDCIFFLGDGLSDFLNLPITVPFYEVSGNCDFFVNSPDEKIIEIENRKIFLTHGHNYYVKSGINALIKKANSENFDFVIFGHTHQFYHEKHDQTVFINPGALKSRMGGATSFVILEINAKNYLVKRINF